MNGSPLSLPEILVRRWLTFCLTGSAIGVVVAMGYFAQPLRYEAYGIFNAKETELREVERDDTNELLKQLEFLDEFLNRVFLQTNRLNPEAKLIKADDLLQQAITSLKIRDHEGNLSSPRSLRRRIILSVPKQTEHDDETANNPVKISLDDSDPDTARDIVNELMRIYVQRNALANPEDVADFSSLVQPQLVLASNFLKQAQQASYQIQLGGASTPLAPQEKTGDQTLQLQSIRINATQQLGTIEGELSDLQAELEVATGAEQLLLREMITLLKNRRDLLAQLVTLLDQPKDAPELSKLLNAFELQILEFKKTLTLTDDAYARFKENQQSPLMIRRSKVNPLRVIRPAVSPQQGERPYKVWFLGGGLLAALIGGAIASLIRERKDTRLLSLADIYHQLRMPIFGMLPRLSASQSSILNLARHEGSEFHEFSRLIEPYQAILRHWSEVSHDRIPQILAVTSLTPQGSKSQVLANLAYCLAKQGKKTLVLDADLSLPLQQECWHLPKAVGVCDYLAGEIQLGKALARVHQNLDLLQAGCLQKNADILLNSPGMELLLQELRTRYDHILIDAPSLAQSVHGYLLANATDAVVLVLSPDQVDRKDVQYLQETLERSQQRLWGMILNRVTQSPHTPKMRQLVQQSQWDATLRLQKKRGDGLEVSSLAAINATAALHGVLMSPAEREAQEVVLYQLPFPELQKRFDALWENWSHDIELLLEQEEEVVQQSRLARKLQDTVERGNPYDKLSSEMQLKDEQEKLDLLAQTYVGQRPRLVEDREILALYWEVLMARADAEAIPTVSSFSVAQASPNDSQQDSNASIA